MIQVPSRVLVIILSWFCVMLSWRASAAPPGPTFTTYPAAAVHYARSVACHQSLCGIVTVHDIVNGEYEIV